MAGTEASFFQEQLFGDMKVAPTLSLGCRSRSTSAGSSLPSIDYPTPQLEAAKRRPSDVPDIDYPSPLVVRNTFLDYGDRSPVSMVEFLRERQTQSCPVSGIGAPPGLEHLGSQGSDSGDADFMPVRPDFFGATPKTLAGLPDFEYPSPFVVKNTFLDTQEAQRLGSLADFMLERGSKSCPASGIGLPPGFSSVSSSFCSGIEEVPAAEQEPRVISCPPAYEPVLPTLTVGPVPPPPPMAPPMMPAPTQLPELPTFVPPPPPTRAPELRIAESLPASEPGSPQLPTVGSAGHHLGNCRPCAFLYTKGCGSGVTCSFCHLCPPGEKKRRQKVKHAAAKMSANLTASGVDAPLAIATAASWAVARAAAQTPPSVYR